MAKYTIAGIILAVAGLAFLAVTIGPSAVTVIAVTMAAIVFAD